MANEPTPDPELPGRWVDGNLPPNVALGRNTILTGDYAFKRFRSKQSGALRIGNHATLDGVHFAVGESGRMSIGNYCYLEPVPQVRNAVNVERASTRAG